mgnify:CR=1 FL=1
MKGEDNKKKEDAPQRRQPDDNSTTNSNTPPAEQQQGEVIETPIAIPAATASALSSSSTTNQNDDLPKKKQYGKGQLVFLRPQTKKKRESSVVLPPDDRRPSGIASSLSPTLSPAALPPSLQGDTNDFSASNVASSSSPRLSSGPLLEGHRYENEPSLPTSTRRTNHRQGATNITPAMRVVLPGAQHVDPWPMMDQEIGARPVGRDDDTNGEEIASDMESRPLLEAVLVQDESSRREDPVIAEVGFRDENDNAPTAMTAGDTAEEVVDAKIVGPFDFLCTRNGQIILAVLLLLVVAVIIMAVSMVLRQQLLENNKDIEASAVTPAPTMVPNDIILWPTIDTPTMAPSSLEASSSDCNNANETNIFCRTPSPTAGPSNDSFWNDTFSNGTQDTNNETTSPTTSWSPTFAPTPFDWSSLNRSDPILNLPLYTKLALQNTSSPQAQAYDWLEGYPSIESLPEWKREQLFALATFYFAMNGPDWMDDFEVEGNVRDTQRNEGVHWLNYSMEECEWGEHGDGFGNYCFGAESGNNESMGHFQQLRVDDLLNVRGSMPREVAMLSSLERIYFHTTDWSVPLEDAIPEQFYEMENLDRLNYESSLLYSTIPTSVAKLTQLSWFRVNGNLLTSTLPSELGLMTNLELLYPSNNLLNGTLPTELAAIRNLTMFRGNNNRFTGYVPSEFGYLTKLSMLTLLENSFSGPLPTELGLLHGMDTLSLYSNDFSGVLPSELGQMSILRTLWIHSNRFEGSLPSEFGLLTSLTSLKLNNNDIRGVMPQEICNLPILEELFVDCAKISCPANCSCTCCSGSGAC